MFPYIGAYQTNSLLILLCLLIALVATVWKFGSQEGYLKSLAIVFASLVAAILGSRLLHVVWERPAYFREHPEQVLASLDGMTLYGGVVLAGLTIYAFTFFFRLENRGKIWDLAAVVTLFSIGVLRIGCFASGCCWGSICRYPWSVRYFHPDAAMPYLGIPVHPVQLYESAGAFALAFVFARLKSFEGRKVFLFFVGYGILRFFTEFFRGDSFRGVDLLFGLSTSQLISLGMIAFGSVNLIPRFFTRKLVATATVLALLFLTGCLPKEPDSSVVSQQFVLPLDLQLINMTKQKLSNRNLLLIATDDTVQQQFAEPIQAAYKSQEPIRIEDLSWWLFAPSIRDVYDQVIRIPYDKFNKASLFRSLAYLESMGKPYDIFLLTHGLPNNIVASKGNPLITFKDLAELDGRLPKLRLLFNQACFGDQLNKEWLAAGAKFIVHYKGLNRNFFYPGFLLKNLKKLEVAPAYEKTNVEIHEKISKSRLYTAIIETIGYSVEEYFEIAPNPGLTSAK